MFEEPSTSLDDSMPLEPMRLKEVTGPAADVFKALLTNLVEQHPGKKTKEQRHAIRDTYRIISLNVIFNSRNGIYTGVPRAANAFGPNSYFKKLGLSYRFTKATLDQLGPDNHGLIDVHIGFFDRRSGIGRSTRIYGTEKLATALCKSEINIDIKISEGDGAVELRDFPPGFELPHDHPDRIRMNKINCFLSNFSWAHKSPMRLIRNRDCVSGGRVYTRVQNLPQAQRRQLQINGYQTVELDFKANHLRIAIVMFTDKAAPEDPYAVVAHAAAVPRPMVKTFYMAALSANNRETAFNACKSSRINRDLFNSIELASKKVFPEVPLFSGLGIYLQSLEGEVAIQVMCAGADHGVAVIPIHDSFICAEQHESWLAEQMTASWKEVMNTSHQPQLEKK